MTVNMGLVRIMAKTENCRGIRQHAQINDHNQETFVIYCRGIRQDAQINDHNQETFVIYCRGIRQGA
jgi:hypothetical protein